MLDIKTNWMCWASIFFKLLTLNLFLSIYDSATLAYSKTQFATRWWESHDRTQHHQSSQHPAGCDFITNLEAHYALRFSCFWGIASDFFVPLTTRPPSARSVELTHVLVLPSSEGSSGIKSVCSPKFGAGKRISKSNCRKVATSFADWAPIRQAFWQMNKIAWLTVIAYVGFC